jgi:hypothetical protein
MGFGDRFKDLTQQAKEKVAENREKIQEAVDAASVAANERTNGKYANKIMKVNQKTGSALDKLGADAAAGGQDGADAGRGGAATGEAGGAATGEAGGAGSAQPQYSAPVGDPPSFADDAPAAAPASAPAAGPASGGAAQPGAASAASSDGPQFDD